MVLALALALALHAGPPSLQDAERAYESGEYDLALSMLNAVLARSLEPVQRLRAFELLGLTHAAFNQSADAESAFEHALEIDPKFDLGPKASPKIRSLFATAQSAVARRQAAQSPLPVVVEAPVARPVEPSRWVKPLAWVSTGTGAALLAGGGAFALVAKHHWDVLEGAQPVSNPAAYAAGGRSLQTAAIALAAAGAVALGLGGGLFWHGSAVHPAVALSPGGAAVALTGTWP